MVGIHKKYATAVISTKSPDKPASTVPQRELMKRKGVHFEDQSPNENGASTSEAETKQWKYVASCFGLMDEHQNEHREQEMNELLELCNFYEPQESKRNLTDADDDEYIPYDVFAEQGMRMSYKPVSVRNPTVSSLNLGKMLRIDSRPNLSTSRKFEKIEEEDENGEAENIPSTLLVEETEQIEMAFQGNLPCSNPQQTHKRRSAEKTQEREVVEPEENFWSNVEF